MVISPIDVYPAIVIKMNDPLIRVRKDVIAIKMMINPVAKM